MQEESLMTSEPGHTYLRTHQLQDEHLQLDLREAATELREQSPLQDRSAVTLVKQSGMSVVLTHLREGASLAEHAAAGPVTVQVLDGHVQMQVGDESLEASAGRLVAFDAGVRHSVTADEPSVLLLTLASPPDA
jgi:quercetin dioxygenase-like cupin family protein